MTQELLRTRDIQVCHGLRVVAEVDGLALDEAQVLAVIGPNGAGKTTILSVLSLLEKPTHGEVLYRGKSVPTRGPARLALRRRFGCVFQDPLLLDRSALENAALPLLLRGVQRRQALAKAHQWLDRLGISHVASQTGATLSGGEAQRVNLARTLIVEPEAVFLDEPLAALDTPTRERWLRELPALLSGRATLLVTHDHGEARRLGHRVAVMFDGRIAQLGTPDEVFQRPVSFEVARFVGVENLINAQVEGNLVELCSGQRLEPSAAFEGRGQVVLCLRAESLRLGPAQRPDRELRLRGRVMDIAPRAEGFAVQVDIGVVLEARAYGHDLERYGVTLHQDIDLHFDAVSIHVVPRP